MPEVVTMHAEAPSRQRITGTRAGAALAVVVALLAAPRGPADDARALEVALDGDEKWWVGVVSESHRMPLDRSSASFEIDLLGNTVGNQVQPLLLSTKGRYVWSEEPFRLTFRDGRIAVRASR